jgi:hypothetical protein
MMMGVEQSVERKLAGELKYSEKTCPLSTLSTTNPHDLTTDRTQANVVGSQELMA